MSTTVALLEGSFSNDRAPAPHSLIILSVNHPSKSLVYSYSTGQQSTSQPPAESNLLVPASLGSHDHAHSSAPARGARAYNASPARCIAYPPILSPTLDTLVAVLVQPNKVDPHLLLPLFDHVAGLERLETLLEMAQGLRVEFVLMRFQVSELRESFGAVVQFACERLGGCVNDFVSSDVAMLGESLAADVAVVWTFTSVSSFVSLEVAQLAEALPASGFLAYEWLDPGMRSCVDLKMCLLEEGLATVGHRALILLSSLGLRRLGGFRPFLWATLFCWLLGLDGTHEGVDIGGGHR